MQNDSEWKHLSDYITKYKLKGKDIIKESYIYFIGIIILK